MDKYEMSAMDAYINRAFKVIIILPFIGTLTSVPVFTFFKIAGLWPNVPTIPLIIYDILNIVYLIIAIGLRRTSIDESGTIKPAKIRQTKIFVGVMLVAQWNYISYLIPDREWWGYLFFFIGLTIVFFDQVFTAVISLSLLISSVISWVIRWDYLFIPQDDPYFLTTVIMRGFCILLSIITFLCITYMGGRYLMDELEKHVNYDPLTHLYNRRIMSKILNEELEKAEKDNSVFCLIMIDIDDFKHVNDNYGHDCGDEVLKYISYAIQTGVKKEDYVFRWGGEEILAYIKADMSKTIAVAERIRKDIEKDAVDYKNEIKVAVTVTMGISQYEPGKTISAMMEEADERLYYGKKHGKNQVVSS